MGNCMANTAGTPCSHQVLRHPGKGVAAAAAGAFAGVEEDQAQGSMVVQQHGQRFGRDFVGAAGRILEDQARQCLRLGSNRPWPTKCRICTSP